MANRDRNPHESLPPDGTQPPGDDTARLPEAPPGSFRKPTAVGCVFAPSKPRIGELSPADYAERVDDL